MKKMPSRPPARGRSPRKRSVVAKLEDSDGYVRREAVETLGKLKGERMEHVAAVSAKLRGRNELV